MPASCIGARFVQDRFYTQDEWSKSSSYILFLIKLKAKTSKNTPLYMDLNFHSRRTLYTLLTRLRWWLRRQALNWVLQLKGGRVTASDAQAFIVWRTRSAAHQQVWADTAALWRMVGQGLRLYTLQSSDRPVPEQRSSFLLAFALMTARRRPPARSKY